MISATISLAMHIILSSYQGVRSIGRVLQYALPYTTMAPTKVNFDTRHLKKGDPLPPFTGKPRVYNMRFCPYAQRTILALNAKGIDYEVVNIDLIDKPEWLTTKSAFAKVPAIEFKEGETIYESLVTVEYLDEYFPQRPLLPKDPVKKAFDKIIIEATGPVQTYFFKLIRTPDAITEENIVAYLKALEFIQDQLKSRGTTFIDGNEPGFADYMIWPWFERIVNFDNAVKLDDQKFKLLLEYLNNMKKDPAVSQYAVPKDIILKFLEGYGQGKRPNYEILHQQ